jgi:hypothetical protein
MRIAVIVKLNNGCDFYRCILPIQHMPWQKEDKLKLFYNDGITIPEEHQDFADNLKNLESFSPDIIFFNRSVDNEGSNFILRWKKKGAKIVVDIDDYWELGTKNYLHDWWYKIGMNKLIKENLELADLVITTNEQLYSKVRALNLNCIICPNAVPYGTDYYKVYNGEVTPAENKKMNFLYAGGSTHYWDLNILTNKFDKIGGDKWIQDRARFVLAGYNPINQDRVHCEWDKMASIFKRTKSYEILKTAPIEEHMLFYDIADVVLVPLVNNEFNACKSILKILEASTRELPCIVSQVKPFYPELKDCPIMWDNWLDNIKYCIKNPEAIKEQGLKLAEQMQSRYDIKIWALTRYQVFTHILNK